MEVKAIGEEGQNNMHLFVFLLFFFLSSFLVSSYGRDGDLEVLRCVFECSFSLVCRKCVLKW